MTEKNEIRISVRNLVEFVLRRGDIDSRFIGNSRAIEGTRAHKKIQSSYIDGYDSEVSLSCKIDYKDFLFRIEGRADGVFEENDNFCIDEIKSTTKPLEEIDENYNVLHWAQAKCYGYIFAREKGIESIDIQLTYYNINTEKIKHIRKTFSIGELGEFFYSLIDKYLVWANYILNWSIVRDYSIKSLGFPYERYRRGQRELAIAVYKTIADNKKLFAQAPTGIGKTISTLYPTVKAMGEGLTSKIFYLTAKTITREAALDCIKTMHRKGLRLKTLVLTAKDKICFKEEPICNPEKCEFARGHFDRVNQAILSILKDEDIITREIVEKYAKDYCICPFEFSLDLAIWADCVICDYNYVFDPRVYLKRFFMDSNNDYVFLVDEAHNLVDRSREMFSAELYKKEFLELRKVMKDKNDEIYKELGKLNSFMLKMKKKCGEQDYYIEKESIDDIFYLLRKFLSSTEEWLIENEDVEGHKELLELYFNVLSYVKIYELYDERYVTYIEKENNDVKIKMFCLDPSHLLKDALNRGKAAIFFSATLTPIKYFKEILGGNENDFSIRLSSPFDANNLCLLIANNISTRFKNRENTYTIISDYIKKLTEQKKGHYLVFFPSYKYMNEVYLRFVDKYPNVKTIVQKTSMKEKEREEFLQAFENETEQLMIGFAVMGGIFSEGIDLKGDKLVGAIVVGVGLPQLCLERNIIREYFQDKNGYGYEYAYMYPGMNKVLQAAGRVIRTEDDKGVVLLIDDRFMYSSYQALFPLGWMKYKRIHSTDDIKRITKRFWVD